MIDIFMQTKNSVCFFLLDFEMNFCSINSVFLINKLILRVCICAVNNLQLPSAGPSTRRYGDGGNTPRLLSEKQRLSIQEAQPLFNLARIEKIAIKREDLTAS